MQVWPSGLQPNSGRVSALRARLSLLGPRPWKPGRDPWGLLSESLTFPPRQTITNGIHDLLNMWAQQQTRLANGKVA